MPKLDEIRLVGLQFYGYHGALPEEQVIGQRFVVNLTLMFDLAQAGKTDNLVDTVDYGAVAQTAREVVEGPPVKLIERLAEMLAETVLSAFPLLEGICVEVLKPGAPIQIPFSSVSVKITRLRRTALP